EDQPREVQNLGEMQSCFQSKGRYLLVSRTPARLVIATYAAACIRHALARSCLQLIYNAKTIRWIQQCLAGKPPKVQLFGDGPGWRCETQGRRLMAGRGFRGLHARPTR